MTCILRLREILTYALIYLNFLPHLRDLDPECIPLSESLQDTMERSLPLLIKRILPDIRLGKTVLVVAHANSLRGKVQNRFEFR